MPMMTPDGLIHAVTSRETDRAGRLVCGRWYQKRGSRDFVPWDVPTCLRVTVTRTIKMPTCLWCVTGTEF